MTESTPTVVVTSDETLPEVIQRLQGAASGGHTVHLVVPIDSSQLLTANEFRTLKDALDDQRLSVVVRTADPLRLRLGERLGVPVQALPRPKMTAAATLPAKASTIEPSKLGPILEPFVEIPEATGQDPALLWPSQNGHDTGADAEDESAATETAATESVLGIPARRWLPVAVLLALIVVATFFLIRFVVPHAVVRVAPKTAPVMATLVFDVTQDGQPLDDQAAFALSPTTRRLEVVWEGSVPTTGVRVEPDGTATGPIELRNATSEAATVDAGTTVVTESGVEFAFVVAVTVPAMDPATDEPGAATGAVLAVAPGTGGNVGTGEIGGRLPNGVYYSNRMEPAAGGTDKEFPVVAQADLDALKAAARDGADEVAAKSLSQNGESGAFVVSNVSIIEEKDEFDHQANEEAESVSLRSTLSIEATAFSLDEASAKFKDALTERLTHEVPSGFVVSPEDIAFEPPREVETQDGGMRFEIVARADAVAELDDAERNALAAKLAGADKADVAAILADSPDVAEFTVEYGSDWFSNQMPNNASRIQIELVK
jgi:hypothetical protein